MHEAQVKHCGEERSRNFRTCFNNPTRQGYLSIKDMSAFTIMKLKC